MVMTQIEITSPPAVVRQKFLQFDQIPKYSPNGRFKSIGPTIPDTPLEPGTKMRVKLSNGMRFQPVLLKNSPTTFSWGGSIPYIFTGEHRFHFHESELTQGGTTFIHEEQFSGLLKYLVGVAGLEGKMKEKFGGFNEDLKTWVDGGG